MRAFIFDEVHLPLRSTIRVVGRTGRVATNYQGLLDLLNSICETDSDVAATFWLQVHVEEEASVTDELPYFRGMHHVVFAHFGPSNRFVFDIADCTVSAAITREMAHDRRFWQERLLPIAVGVLGASIGVLPLHAACLSFEGKGLLIAGASGTGKSTLSLALARNGADFISDDWTYITQDSGQLRAHGMSAPVKLLPDAVKFFPELREHDLQISLNGELAYELAARDRLQLRLKTECEPDCLVFYERTPSGKPDLIKLSGEEARNYISSSVEPLPRELSALAERRDYIASRIAELPCWRFRHAGSPQLAAQTLQVLFAPEEQVRIRA